MMVGVGLEGLVIVDLHGWFGRVGGVIFCGFWR